MAVISLAAAQGTGSKAVANGASGFLFSSPVDHALVAGTLVAICAGVVGTFAVFRGQSFATHSLSDIGAAGGAAALLAGVTPLAGFASMGTVAAIALESAETTSAKDRDITTGVLLGGSFGLSALLLYLASNFTNVSGATTGVLFGSLFTVSASTLPFLAAISVVVVLSVGLVARRLTLASFDPDLVRVKGKSPRTAGLIFLVALGLAVAMASLSLGAILSAALMIGPAASVLRLTSRVGTAVLTASLLAVAETWLGIYLAYESYSWPPNHDGWPASFLVVALVLLVYLASRGLERLRVLMGGNVGLSGGSATERGRGATPHV